MSRLDEIEIAVSQLSLDDLTKFRDWFAEFDARHWDQQIEQDVRDLKLDPLMDQALDHLRSDRCSSL